MSILLEALKKSEEQRQLGSTPNIHSQAGESQRSGPPFRHWLPLALIVVSAVILTWFGWQQFSRPEPAGDVPVAESLTRDSGGTVTKDTGKQSAPAESAQRETDGPDRGDAVPRTPVEEFAAPPEQKSEPAAPELRSISDHMAGAEAEPDAGPGREAPDEQAPPADDREVADAAAVASQPKDSAYRPPQPGFITYWELPQGVRDSLPDIRITVLVYAQKPEDRFVLINGQRLVEGDEVLNGVLLDEIKREGAVFRYRKYRFLVEG